MSDATLFRFISSYREALDSFAKNLEGLGQTRRAGDFLILVVRPQEVVAAVQALGQANADYYGAVADYNRAQFELFHAVGYPAREVVELRLPGDLRPVDTARPAFLPPVGNGPPPATR